MSMSVHMFVYSCELMFIFYPYGRRVGEETRKDVTTAEGLQKAGQITSRNPCIHVSALWACGLCERANARQAI